MMNMIDSVEEHVDFRHPNGGYHTLAFIFRSGPEIAIVAAAYVAGIAPIQLGTRVALWQASYESPAGSDPGHVWFGDGRIDLDVECLRGIGIGSLLMLPLVRWAKMRRYDVPVVPINLKADDAVTPEARDRRNRFYEKLGFVFNYVDADGSYGEAREMRVSNLITPKFTASRDWIVRSVSGTGQVF